MTRPHKCKLWGIRTCFWCVTGKAKRPARRKERHEGKKETRQ